MRLTLAALSRPITVVVAMLARHFVPRTVPGHTPQVWMDGTLGSRNGLPMLVEQR